MLKQQDNSIVATSCVRSPSEVAALPLTAQVLLDGAQNTPTLKHLHSNPLESPPVGHRSPIRCKGRRCRCRRVAAKSPVAIKSRSPAAKPLVFVTHVP